MEKRKFWSYENKLVTIFFFVIGFVFFDRLAINFLVPFIQKDFTLTNTQIGLLGSALSLVWAFSSPLGGFLSDKVKSRKTVLAIFVLGFSVISLSQGLVATFALLFVLRMIMGLLEGPIVPITQSILVAESSESRRGFNLGFTLNTANGVFGSFLAPLVIVALANLFDWRTAFYLTIIPGIMIVFFIWKSVREPKRLSEEAASQTSAIEKLSLKDVLGHRNIWLTVLIFSCFMIYLMAFQIFGPVYMVNDKHMSTTTMSFVMAAFGAGTAILGFVVPAISDRIGRKPTALIFGFLSIFAPFAILYVQSEMLMVVLVFLFSSGMGVGALLMSVIPSESVPAKYRGIAIGLTTGIGELFGGVLNPIFSGMAADVWGLSAPLLISSCGALLAFILSMFLIETAPVKIQANSGIKMDV
ncbi:MFS transporter [Paenibacillus thalictri]|uniref:MFS transporter n=1 Tax=Paenibacillus thalictri TaxID=2527873 RepID=A0A4Q9DQ92_9BACL|nr:MFS transporter [Paenibacillus thalictri]TBL76563.1 MFS transporter [Paenibacillus thalictri]